MGVVKESPYSLKKAQNFDNLRAFLKQRKDYYVLYFYELLIVFLFGAWLDPLDPLTYISLGEVLCILLYVNPYLPKQSCLFRNASFSLTMFT